MPGIVLIHCPSCPAGAVGPKAIFIEVDRWDAAIGTLLETVRVAAVGEGKYICQTGGVGNYGHCKLRLEPNELGNGYEFFNSVYESLF